MVFTHQRIGRIVKRCYFVLGLDANKLIVNGNHLAADGTFIEKRRRGLARFANALVRHPILGQEQLVIMFLTVPTVSLSHIFLMRGNMAKTRLISTRNWLYGASKPLFRSKKSL